MTFPVLVTGGAGYIGSHAAKALAVAGFKPVVFDNLSTGNRSSVKWGPLVKGDLADQARVLEVLRDCKIEAVIHFAACASVGESMKRPEKYFRNNLVNTLNLLDAMTAVDVKDFVFSSTCATYGIPEEIPIAETHPQKPINPYGESKLLVERALRWYGEAHGLRWAALRYFNAAGADPDGLIGESPHSEPRLISAAIQAALGPDPTLEIFGTDYPTPDGTAVRDYVHVTDLANAHILALNYLVAGGQSQALNLGTGKGISVREVIAGVVETTGRQIEVREVQRRPGDPSIMVADASRARTMLGWTPEYSDLHTVIHTAAAWFSSHAPDRE